MSDPLRLSTRVDESGPGHLELDAAELRVVGGPDRGKKLLLDEHAIVVGTSPECRLALTDATVSARHAEVVLGHGGWSLRDLGSKNGVRLHGWLVESVPLADRLELRLGKTTLQVHALGGRRAVVLERPGQFAGLVAHSVKMRALVAQLAQLAGSDTTVLIEGETGSGKELAARALHDWSARAAEPLTVFDCGAVLPTLAAAELFGHERGAQRRARRSATRQLIDRSRFLRHVRLLFAAAGDGGPACVRRAGRPLVGSCPRASVDHLVKIGDVTMPSDGARPAACAACGYRASCSTGRLATARIGAHGTKRTNAPTGWCTGSPTTRGRASGSGSSR